jgi:hypothetical protein
MRRPKLKHDLVERARETVKLVHCIEEGWTLSRIMAKYRVSASRVYEVAKEHKMEVTRPGEDRQ